MKLLLLLSMEHEKTFSRTDLAKHFGVCYITVLNWKKKGLIKPYCVINQRERYRLQDVQDLLAPKPLSV